MKKAELARQLGLSRAMITKHAQMGMPTDSLAAAQAWRDANLDIALTKPFRRAELCERDYAAEVLHINALGKRAYSAWQHRRRREFVSLVDSIRAGWQALPEAHHNSFTLPLEVWYGLCAIPGPWLDHLNEGGSDTDRVEIVMPS